MATHDPSPRESESNRSDASAANRSVQGGSNPPLHTVLWLKRVVEKTRESATVLPAKDERHHAPNYPARFGRLAYAWRPGLDSAGRIAVIVSIGLQHVYVYEKPSCLAGSKLHLATSRAAIQEGSDLWISTRGRIKKRNLCHEPRPMRFRLGATGPEAETRGLRAEPMGRINRGFSRSP